MSVHSIRLNGPWHYQASATFPCAEELAIKGELPVGTKFKVPTDWAKLLSDAGPCFTFIRRFNQPTGIREDELVQICFEKLDHNAKACLNGRLLTMNSAEEQGEIKRCDIIKSQLLSFNTICVAWDQSISESNEPFAAVNLEISSQ